MNVVGHHDSNLEIESIPVVMKTAFEHDGSDRLREHPSVVSTERDEMGLVIDLKMRQLPAIKSMRHIKRMYLEPHPTV